MKKSLILIELLLSVAMTVLISVGIYRAFSSGIAVWKAHYRCKSDENVYIFLEKLAFDLRNCAKYSANDFNGDNQKICFFRYDDNPLFLSSDSLSDEPLKNSNIIYKVEYSFSPENKTVKRIMYNLSEGKPIGKSVLLTQITDMEFKFFIYDKQKNLIEASSLAGVIPEALSIKINAKDNSGNTMKIKQVITIPINA